jgi:hypothetical protein
LAENLERALHGADDLRRRRHAADRSPGLPSRRRVLPRAGGADHGAPRPTEIGKPLGPLVGGPLQFTFKDPIGHHPKL